MWLHIASAGRSKKDVAFLLKSWIKQKLKVSDVKKANNHRKSGLHYEHSIIAYKLSMDDKSWGSQQPLSPKISYLKKIHLQITFFLSLLWITSHDLTL